MGSRQVPPRHTPPFSHGAPLAFMQRFPLHCRQGPGQLSALQAGGGGGGGGSRQEPPWQEPPSPQAPPSLAFRQARSLAEHARQGPAQLAAEQVPTQRPSWHWARFPEQDAGVQVGAQLPFRHWPPGQSVPAAASTQRSATQIRQGRGQFSAVHAGGAGARQEPPSHRGRAAGQLSTRVVQVPLASQIRVVSAPSPLQEGAPQVLPIGCRRHPPWPSQPSVQALFSHCPLGSESPAGTLVHVPSEPGTLHDRQAPLQALAQHRPEAQMPLTQSCARLQTAPLGRLPQSPPVQRLPSTHCPLPLQEVRHRLPLHPRKGAQLRGGGTRQVPSWQVPAEVS